MLLRDNQIGKSAVRVKNENENSQSCVQVLHKTLNLVISPLLFCRGRRRIYQNLTRTCRAILFAHQTYCIAALPLPLVKFPIVKLCRRITGQSPSRTHSVLNFLLEMTSLPMRYRVF